MPCGPDGHFAAAEATVSLSASTSASTTTGSSVAPVRVHSSTGASEATKATEAAVFGASGGGGGGEAKERTDSQCNDPRLSAMNDKEEAALCELRGLVGYQDPKSDDSALLRFLRARRLDVAKAHDMWTKWVKWRSEFKVDSISLRTIKSEILSGKAFWCVVQLLSRGGLYSNVVCNFLKWFVWLEGLAMTNCAGLPCLCCRDTIIPVIRALQLPCSSPFGWWSRACASPTWRMSRSFASSTTEQVAGVDRSVIWLFAER